MKMNFNIYKNKTVVVTGHTGFKGSWLTQWLVLLGAKVVGISNDIPSRPSHFESMNLKKDILIIMSNGDFDGLSRDLLERYRND